MKKKIQTSRKRLLSVLLAVVMVLTALPLTALSALAATSGDFEYEVLSETDKTCQITDYTGSATELAIPSELDGYTVTSIGDEAFEDCTSLTSITIPNSVTSINYGAFRNCTSLGAISLPNSLRYVGQNTFDNTAYFNNDSNWENGVLYVDTVLCKAKSDAVLGDYTVKKGTVGIASMAFVTENGWWDFSGNTTLTSVTLPDTVKFIGASSFFNCSALVNIILPNSIEKIGAYSYETGLGNAFEGTAYWKDMNNWTEDGCLYIDNYLIGFRQQEGQTILNIREGTVTVSDMLFLFSSALFAISFPRSIQHIGDDNVPYTWDGSSSDGSSCTFGKIYGYAGTVVENYCAQYPSMCEFIDITPKISVPDGDTGTIEVPYDQMTVGALANELQYQDSTIQSIAATDKAGNEVTDMHAVCSTEMIFTITYSNGTTAVFTLKATQTVLMGDVNGDDKINAVDARFVLQAASGARVLDDTQKAAADVNGDGKINAVDARWILQVASGVRTL